MNIAEMPDDSDTSDDDYVPEGKQENIPSEVDSDGDSEDPLSDKEDLGKRGQKRKKKSSKTKKEAKPNSGTADTNDGAQNLVKSDDAAAKKKQEEDLWADFMKDTGFKPKSSRNDSPTPTPKPNHSKIEQKQPVAAKVEPEKVKVVQVFEFAGEEVKVEKEVPVSSAEARLLGSASDVPKTSRGSLSGISNVLSQLGKKQKISTLEKTKLDWDKFKKEENLDEELRTFNKGKDGYLERQDFLQRADLRRFEIEKEIRTVERSKRYSN